MRKLWSSIGSTPIVRGVGPRPPALGSGAQPGAADPLTRDDFIRILTEPANALLKQYIALMATEGVQLRFTDDAIAAIADVAALMLARSVDKFPVTRDGALVGFLTRGDIVKKLLKP